MKNDGVEKAKNDVIKAYIMLQKIDPENELLRYIKLPRVYGFQLDEEPADDPARINLESTCYFNRNILRSIPDYIGAWMRGDPETVAFACKRYASDLRKEIYREIEAQIGMSDISACINLNTVVGFDRVLGEPIYASELFVVNNLRFPSPESYEQCERIDKGG